MRSRITRLLLLLLGGTFARAAAPDTIGGLVYREAMTVVPALSERTIAFGVDGHYTAVKTAGGSTTVLTPIPNKVFLFNSSPDGTYVYQRTGDSTGRITFQSGITGAWDLTFTTATGGVAGDAGSVQNRQFALTPLDNSGNPLNNLSVRGSVASGRTMIAGFVVPGVTGSQNGNEPFGPAGLREVLIRVVGPSLAPFGVASPWADPDFQIYRGAQRVNTNEISYPDWSVRPQGSFSNGVDPDGTDTQAAFRKIFDFAGAFPLQANSRDAAAVFRLQPGAYTIVCAPAANDPGGEALIEVYFLP